MGVEEHIFPEEGDFGGDQLTEGFGGLGAGQILRQVGIGLVGGKEFDGQDLFKLFSAFQSLLGGVVTHGDVVFLVGAGGDVVHHGGQGEAFHVVEQAGLGVLGDHESAVEAGLGDQEVGVAGDGAVNEAVGAAFRHFGHHGGGDGGGVHFHADVGGVGIAGGDGQGFFRGAPGNGVVAAAGELVFQGFPDAVETFLGGAVELGHAAQRQGILQAVVQEMAADFGIAQDPEQLSRGFSLPALAPDTHHAGIEGLEGGLGDFQGHGGNQVGADHGLEHAV